jgi:hypothetical protein
MSVNKRKVFIVIAAVLATMTTSRVCRAGSVFEDAVNLATFDQYRQHKNRAKNREREKIEAQKRANQMALAKQSREDRKKRMDEIKKLMTANTNRQEAIKQSVAEVGTILDTTEAVYNQQQQQIGELAGVQQASEESKAAFEQFYSKLVSSEVNSSETFIERWRASIRHLKKLAEIEGVHLAEIIPQAISNIDASQQVILAVSLSSLEETFHGILKIEEEGLGKLNDEFHTLAKVIIEAPKILSPVKQAPKRKRNPPVRIPLPAHIRSMMF